MSIWTVYWKEANLSGSIDILIVIPFEDELKQRKKIVFFACVSSDILGYSTETETVNRTVKILI